MSTDQLSDQEWLPASVLPMHKSNFHAQEMILATIYSCSLASPHQAWNTPELTLCCVLLNMATIASEGSLCWHCLQSPSPALYPLWETLPFECFFMWQLVVCGSACAGEVFLIARLRQGVALTKEAVLTEDPTPKIKQDRRWGRMFFALKPKINGNYHSTTCKLWLKTWLG